MSDPSHRMEKGYFGLSGEQVHFRRAGPKGEGPKSPSILCLPPAPHSGAFYDRFIVDMAETHDISSVDYPGYGGSDRLLHDSVSIENYAKRVSSHFRKDTQIDLLGFHSGTLVAVEIAKLHPENVRNILLVDIPFFDASTREKYAAGLKTSLPVPVEETFAKTVTNRNLAIEEERAFYLWVETQRSGKYQSDAFRAAFSYDCQAEFPKVTHPIEILATQSGLLEPTRQAAQSFPNNRLTERLDIMAPVFEAHSQEIAKWVRTL